MDRDTFKITLNVILLAAAVAMFAFVLVQ